MNIQVQPDLVSGAENPCLIDAGKLQDQTFKILQGLELIGTLVKGEKQKTPNREHEAFLDSVQFLASTLADMASNVLDNLPSVEASSGPSIYETRGLLSL